MKIIFFTKYSRHGASSRLRSYQYIPFIKYKKQHIKIYPLFDYRYLERLYAGKKNHFYIPFYYLKRFFLLLKISKQDVVIIEKELFPYFPPIFEYFFKVFKINYIVDYDDAVFHNYDLSSNIIVRSFFRKKINKIMRWSNKVTVCNEYLASKARNSGAKDIIIIPTVVDLNRYLIERKIKNTKIIIGWIGTPSTFKYYEKLIDILNILQRKYNLEFHVVGMQNIYGYSNSFKFIKWTEDTEVSLINKFDIGIMPLSDTPWEKGKCAYKLIQYMACGVPVVGSSIGMNKQVIINNYNGFLANESKDWLFFLEKLIVNKQLRIKFGKNGRELIEKKYSLQSQLNIYNQTILK